MRGYGKIRAMNKLITVCAAALVCVGCFDNKGKPEDVPTVIGVQALMTTNRSGIVRVILRGDRQKIPAGALSGLDSIKMIDLSERGTKDVPPEVLSLKGLKEFYFARNGMVTIPDLSCWADTLDYLNLDDNEIAEVPDSLAKLTKLKWLRLNGNKIASLPASLASLKDMRRIYLKGDPKQGGKITAIPEVLKGWTMLEDVTFDGNPITSVPEWLLAMPHLRTVSLNRTNIERLPSDLSGWKRLDFLALGECRIQKGEMERIRKALPDVAVVF